MKIRILSIACIASAAALLAACTIVNRNASACEQLMRSKLAETSSGMSYTLRVAHRGAAIRGSRVVVEGSIEHFVSASEVAAATPPAASAPNAASDLEVAARPAQPKKVSTPAAAECTFHGEQLDVFRWLAPAQLATPVAQPASTAG